jgi:hypothetical protein
MLAWYDGSSPVRRRRRQSWKVPLSVRTVNNSRNMQPSEKTSELRPRSSPNATSGAQYSYVFAVGPAVVLEVESEKSFAMPLSC